MFSLLRALLKAEILRLWRRMLGRPEPPGAFAEFRTRLEQDGPLESPGPGESDPQQS